MARAFFGVAELVSFAQTLPSSRRGTKSGVLRGAPQPARGAVSPHSKIDQTRSLLDAVL
ncbi:MAG: hypothetical protein ACR2HX_11295 [Pyrinomonadaceae bacterium]